jgi:hypothetical protein
MKKNLNIFTFMTIFMILIKESNEIEAESIKKEILSIF